MNGLPVDDRYLELLRESLGDMRSVIDQMDPNTPTTPPK